MGIEQNKEIAISKIEIGVTRITAQMTSRYESIRSKQHRRLTFEFAELRLQLSAFAYLPHDIVLPSDANEPTAVHAADIDGDGDKDVLSSSRRDGKLAWYVNTDGNGSFGQQFVISAESRGATWVHAADMDGDLDKDVLGIVRSKDSPFYSYDIVWHENLNGNGVFGEQKVIASGLFGISNASAGDIDGDGDIDIVSSSRRLGRVAWHENRGAEIGFSDPQIITGDARGVYAVKTADVDGDDDLDIISSAWDWPNDGNINWYENVDGEGGFGEPRVFTATLKGTGALQVADVDSDGDADVLSATLNDFEVVWFENTDGKTFGERHVIDTVDGWKQVHTGDLDGDGDQDAIVASSGGRGSIAWYENVDGKGMFVGPRLITENAIWVNSLLAIDVDDDSDIDVLSASEFDDKVAWYPNLDARGAFGAQNLISSPSQTIGIQAVAIADIDSDGDLDFATASSNDNKVAWFENSDGQGDFGRQVVISTHAEFAYRVATSDFDGDGDRDVLSVSLSDNRFLWYENIDGMGTFQEKQVIDDPFFTIYSIGAADIDGDGDDDVIAMFTSRTSFDRREDVFWYENTDGRGTFGPGQLVARHINGGRALKTVDMDGDGDVDVVTASEKDKIQWFENQGRVGGFAAPKEIVSDDREFQSVIPGDLDGDGDIDLVTMSRKSVDAQLLLGEVLWYENVGELGVFKEHRISFSGVSGEHSVSVSDMDKDGDLDILFASVASNVAGIAWYENVDGNGTFSELHLAASGRGAEFVHSADFDNDGDADILSGSNRSDSITWFESRKIGDSNNDGSFDSSDFVTVFAAGEFEDGIPGNSTFDTGDWNQDGDFGTSDLVFAFQFGNYKVNEARMPNGLASAINALRNDEDVEKLDEPTPKRE